MNQLLIGAAVPFAVGMLIYAGRRFRAGLAFLTLLPILMAMGMIWAIAPDIPRLLGKMPLYYQLANDPRCDLFFWHYTIDRMESDSSWFAVGFIAVLATLVAIAWREVRLREEER